MEAAALEEEQSRGKGVEEEEDERSTDNDPGSDNEEDQGKDPDLEEGSETDDQEGGGDEAAVKPPDQEHGEAQEESHKEGMGEGPQSLGEKLLEKKKPPRNLLDSLRNRNAKGLEQDPALLGPGAILYIKWSDTFRKETKSPWNTAWGYISLTEECSVSKPEKPTWNWVHPTDQNLTGHIKLEPSRAWEVVTGIITKEQEESRVRRNKEPAHEYNTLKSPTMTKVALKVQAHQPEPVDNETEEFLGHAERFPMLFEEGTLENQKVVNVTADSRHFEVEVSQQKDQDVISLHSTASTAALSVHSSVIQNYLNGLSPIIKSHLFNVALDNIKITNPEVRALADRELRALKLIKSMTKAAQENRKASTIRKVWEMLQPVRMDFLDANTLVGILCVDAGQTEDEEDLDALNMLNIFTDTSDLEGSLTGLDKLTVDLQATLVGQYGGTWTIGNRNQNSDLTANQRISKDAKKSQARPDPLEGGATGATQRKFIPPPSAMSSLGGGQQDNGAPLATSGPKAAGPGLDQDHMNLNHRISDLARQKQEIERMRREQEEYLKHERAEMERMRKKNEELAEKMKRDQEENLKWERSERKRKEEQAEKVKREQEEHTKLRQEIKKMKRIQEENFGWEREQEERVRTKNEERMQKLDKKEREIREAENEVCKDKAALREERKAAEEQRKRDRKRLEQEKRRGEEKEEDAANTDMDKKSKVKSSSSHHNPEAAAGTGEDGSDEDEEGGRKSQEKEKIKKNGRKGDNSITPGSSGRGGGPVKKEFRLMEKRLSRNLASLQDLKKKVEKDPSNLTTGTEDLKQFKTNELLLKLEKLEVDYESDSDHQEELEDLKDLMFSNNQTYQLIKQKLAQAEGSINNATNLRLIGMEIHFTPIDAEILSSPTLYAFLSDVWTRVNKSPLYRTSMRDNLADKITGALMKGNESVVTQLRLSTTNHHDWEEIISYLVAKFGGALRTQELAIQHHESHDRIGYPLESSIIKQQFATIKQHLKATGSVKEMIQYHQKNKTSTEAAAFLQQGGFTQRYLTVLNESLPLITQSSNIDQMEGMSHAKGFELLEKQLLDLHKSAQTMSNRYCAQPFQTLLVTNPTGAKVTNPTGAKVQNPTEKGEMKKEDDRNVVKLEAKLEEMSHELKIVRNKGEREVNQLKKILEDSSKGNGNGKGNGYGNGKGYGNGRAGNQGRPPPPLWPKVPPRTGGAGGSTKPKSPTVEITTYNKALMQFFNQMCAGANPKQPPMLKDGVTGEAIPWVNSWTNQHLATVIQNDNRRAQLLTLMGPAGCKFCTQLLKDQGPSKLIFPHLVFNNNNGVPTQASLLPYAKYCPMLYSCGLRPRMKLLDKLTFFCQYCIRRKQSCCCNNPKKYNDICKEQNCSKHMLACDHKQSKEEVERFKEAYKVEYDKLAKSIFTATQVAPVLGQSSNLITFLLALKELESVPKQQRGASFDDLEEMLEIHAIKKEAVKRQNMKQIYKTHSIKKASDNVGLLTSFTVLGTNGDHMMVISDSGCTGAILDQTVSETDALPVIKKGGAEATSIGGGGEIIMQPAIFLMPFKDNSEYEFQEIAAVETKTIVTPPTKIKLTQQMDLLYSEYLASCEEKSESPTFSRSDCPSQYGGQRVDILMGNKEVIPILEFQASNGLCVYSHPYKTPPGLPRLAVGGSIPTSDSRIINLVMTGNNPKDKSGPTDDEEPDSEDDEEPPDLTDSDKSNSDSENESENEESNEVNKVDKIDEADQSDCDYEISDHQSQLYPCGYFYSDESSGEEGDDESDSEDDQYDTANEGDEDSNIEETIKRTTEALMGEQEECKHQSSTMLQKQVKEDPAKASLHFLSIELNETEKEVVENIKTEVQKKLLLPNPRNRAKPHTSHVTLGLMEFCKNEELEVTKTIREVLQKWLPDRESNLGLTRVDLTSYQSFKSGNGPGSLQTIHLEPKEEHAAKLKVINQELQNQLRGKFKPDNHEYTPHLTLFQAKTDAPLPNISDTDLAMVAPTDSLNTDGKSVIFEPEQKLSVLALKIGLREVGTGKLVAEYTHKLPTSEVVMSTPISILSDVSSSTWKARQEIRTLGKARATSNLARKLSKFSNNTLEQPRTSAHQLIHLAIQTSTQSALDVQIKNLLAPDQDHTAKCHTCARCLECVPLENLPAKEQQLKKRQMEQHTLKAHVSLGADHNNVKRVIVSLPLSHAQAGQLLPGSNRKSVLQELDRKLEKLDPLMKTQIVQEFDKLVNLGFFVQREKLPKPIQQKINESPVHFYISIAPSFKSSSLSTTARCNLNASRHNFLGHSLNSILPTGLSKPNMARSIRRWRLNKVGILADLSKFFNSAYLETSSLCYNMIVFRTNGDISQPAKDYVCSRLFYGLTSSTALAQIGLELIAEQEEKECIMCNSSNKDDSTTCPGLAHQFADLVRYIFVDDIFYSCQSQQEADVLMEYITASLEKYAYSLKGWNYSLKMNKPDDPCLDADLLMSVGGNYYNQETDVIHYKPPIQHNGLRWRGAIIPEKSFYTKLPDGTRKLVEPPELQIIDFKMGKGLTFETLHQLFANTRKTLKLIISKTNSHYDPIGLLSPLISQLRDSCRQATLFCQGRMDSTVHECIWELWLRQHYELLRCTHFSYPRLKNAHLVEYGKIDIICSVDASTGLMLTMHLSHPNSIKTRNVNFHTSHSYLADAGTTVPKRELTAGSIGSFLVNTVRLELGPRVGGVYQLQDSMIAIYWVINNSEHLSTFAHNRVKNIRTNLNVETELFHVSGNFNNSDCGTKFKRIADHREPTRLTKERMLTAEDVSPTSTFHMGPEYYQDMSRAELEGIITSVKTIREKQGSLEGEDLLQFNSEFKKSKTNALKQNMEIITPNNETAILSKDPPSVGTPSPPPTEETLEEGTPLSPLTEETLSEGTPPSPPAAKTPHQKLNTKYELLIAETNKTMSAQALYKNYHSDKKMVEARLAKQIALRYQTTADCPEHDIKGIGYFLSLDQLLHTSFYRTIQVSTLVLKACSQFLAVVGRKLKLMDHTNTRTASLCIEGYRQPGTTTTTHTPPTRKVSDNKVKGTTYTTIRETPGYLNHSDTYAASRTLSRAEHCLAIMAQTDQVKVMECQALVFTKILRALMATLASSKSPSAAHGWVIQDVKILLDHFSGKQILSYLTKAEVSLQNEDVSRMSKIKMEDELTGKLVLLIKRVDQNFRATKLGKPDKSFKLEPRNAPNMFDCISNRQEYELLYRATSFYYSVKVSAELKKFATQKQITNHGYTVGSLVFGRNRLGDQTCVEGSKTQSEILQREGIKIYQLLLDAFSPLSWAIYRHHHQNSRPIGRSSLNMYHHGRDMMVAKVERTKDILSGWAIASILAASCPLCAIRNERFKTSPEGLMSTAELAPVLGQAFMVMNTDLFGPLKVLNHAHQKGTRHTSPQHIYVLVAVCAASKAVRLIPTSNLTTQSMALAFTHLTARVGPAVRYFTDQQSSLMKLFREANIGVKTEKGIKVEAFTMDFCPTGQAGHKSNGLAESTIRSLRKALGPVDFRTLKLGPLEVSSILGILEQVLNEIPVTTKRAGARGDSKTNQGVGKFITPAMLSGDLKNRTLVGHITFNSDLNGYLLNTAEHKQFLDNFLHNFLVTNRKATKGELLKPEELQVGDLVAFRTKQVVFSSLNTCYRFGRVDSILKRKNALEGSSRSAYIAYTNQRGDIADNGEEYEIQGKQVLTLRRIDSLIGLDSGTNLEMEFKSQSRYLEKLYNGTIGETDESVDEKTNKEVGEAEESVDERTNKEVGETDEYVDEKTNKEVGEAEENVDEKTNKEVDEAEDNGDEFHQLKAKKEDRKEHVAKEGERKPQLLRRSERLETKRQGCCTNPRQTILLTMLSLLLHHTSAKPIRPLNNMSMQPMVALEGKPVVIHCSGGNSSAHHISFSWSSRDAVIDPSVDTRGPRLELTKVKLGSAGHYICVGRESDGSASSYIHTLHVVDMPVHPRAIATSQTEQESIKNSRMVAHSCLSPDNQVSHINLVHTQSCAPPEDSQAYSIGVPRSANVIYHEEYNRGKALRCKLTITVEKAACGSGFASMLRYSSIHADVLVHQGLYHLTDKQCSRFHEDAESTITLGERRITLKTGFLGVQETIAYMNGEGFVNSTCAGAESGEKMWLGPSSPEVVSKGGEIIKNQFKLELETEQYELNLKTRSLSIPRLGLEIAATNFNNLSNADASGTITIETNSVPKTECEQYHLVQTMDTMLFEAYNPDGEQLYCRAILVTAPDGIQGIHEPIYPESLPEGGGEGALYRYTSTELHKLLGLYHLEDDEEVGHEAHYVRFDVDGNKYIIKKAWAELHMRDGRHKDRWYITTTEGDAVVYSPGTKDYPGRRPLQAGKVHLSFNRGVMPVGDLHHGLAGSCVLNATKLEEDQHDTIPPILTTKLEVGAEAKSIAYSLMNRVQLCGEECHTTQIRGMYVCTYSDFKKANRAAKDMKLGVQEEKTLENLASGSLNFMQLSVDKSVGQIINQLCEMKRRRIETALEDFEKHGVREFFPPQDRSGLRALSRGETGIIFACKTLYVKPVTALPLCCANQPIRLIGEDESKEVRHFLTPIKREIVTACSPVECSDLLPITYYTDEGKPVCQGTKGLAHCSGGMMADPNSELKFKFAPITRSQSVLGWTATMLKSHMQHIISEVISSTSFQNSFANTLAVNAIRCKGAIICKGAESLANTISQEISRGTSSSLDFFLNWSMYGEILQYLVLGTIALFFSQGLIGAINSCQRRCCRQGGPGVTFCGCMGLFLRTVDRFLNPWSSQRHASGEKIIDLSLALQRVEATVKALGDRIIHLNLRMDHARENLGGEYEDPNMTNNLKKSVTFLLRPEEESTNTTFSDPQDGNYSESIKLIAAEVHQSPVETMVQSPELPKRQSMPSGPLITDKPPPIPKKTSKNTKPVGLSTPLTTRPRLLKKTKKESPQPGYVEMKTISPPKKPPRLGEESLEPLLGK